MEAETRFRAMGTAVHIVVVGADLSAIRRARDLIEDLEGRWSRFRPTSEVSLLNQMAGAPVRVSSQTVLLVRRAIDGARMTGGRFDPTVLGDVIRAGYDWSFELLTEASRDGRSMLVHGVEGVVIDDDASTIMVPPGVGFDPGGVGKGLAADLVAEELLTLGVSGVCVNVGGDLRVEGTGPGGGDWKVGIGHPFRPALIDVALRGGAVASSMRTRRTWGHPSERRHHLIDPATGRPARTGLASASVLASTAWQAEVVAKGAFVAGLSEGLFLLASAGTEGMLVDDAGVVYPSAGLDRFLVIDRVAPAAAVGSAGAA